MKTVSLRFTDEDYARVKAEARARGMCLGPYLAFCAQLSQTTRMIEEIFARVCRNPKEPAQDASEGLLALPAARDALAALRHTKARPGATGRLLRALCEDPDATAEQLYREALKND